MPNLAVCQTKFFNKMEKPYFITFFHKIYIFDSIERKLCQQLVLGKYYILHQEKHPSTDVAVYQAIFFKNHKKPILARFQSTCHAFIPQLKNVANGVSTQVEQKKNHDPSWLSARQISLKNVKNHIFTHFLRNFCNILCFNREQRYKLRMQVCHIIHFMHQLGCLLDKFL